MTRKEPLAELIAKVEAGTLVPVDLIVLEPEEHAWAQRAYDGSLDAAKALRVSILPGPVPEKIHSDARKELLSILRELIALERPSQHGA